jgi:hypothetical protein
VDDEITTKPMMDVDTFLELPDFLTTEISFNSEGAPLFLKNLLAVMHSRTVDEDLEN